MADRGQLSPTGISPHAQGRKSPPRQGTVHPISCTHCRQRKIKCDKIHPCSPCQRSSLECVFPERARHPKKKKTGGKATNDELLVRLSRMEQLIGQLEGDEKTVNEGRRKGSQAVETGDAPLVKRETPPERRVSREDSQASQGSTADNNFNRFIGGSFWRSLTNEVEGLRQTVDEDSDGDDESTPASAQSPPDSQNHSSVVFPSAQTSPRNLRSLHPPPAHISMLCTLFISNVDPMAKVLHIPTLRNLVTNAIVNLDDLPSNNYVEVLLFSMYYSAITTLAPEDCSKTFSEGRDDLLTRYRAGVERALTNADFLNTTELGTLQALTIFLITARTNDDTQFVWSMTGLAIRLAHSISLHRESSNVGLPPFVQELRRRLWWQLIALDVRCCEDRATDPVIGKKSFDTKRPLNINDSDMDPTSTRAIVERVGFTEMTKSDLSYRITHFAWAFGWTSPIDVAAETDRVDHRMNFDQRMQLVRNVEKSIENEVLIYCDPANPLAWVTSVVARLIMCRLRLAVYHPLKYDDRPTSWQEVSREQLLKTAVENVEYSNLLDNHPCAVQWRWFFKTYVQWHALATILAELCVQTEGPMVERAWRIVDIVFEDAATRIADSRHGMLWRPMKRLMSKAQAKRAQTRQSSFSSTSPTQQQQPLPTFNNFDFAAPSTGLSYAPDPMQSYVSLDQQQQQIPADSFADFNINESTGAINWAEFDEFMQDFEMSEPVGDMEMVTLQPEVKTAETWW